MEEDGETHALEGAEAGGSALHAVDDGVDGLGGSVGDGVGVVVEHLVAMALEHRRDLEDGAELHAFGSADEVCEPCLRAFDRAHLPEQTEVLFPEPRLAGLEIYLSKRAEVFVPVLGDVLRPAPRSVKTSAMERLFVLLVAALAFGCSDAERQGGEAWHHARDFVKVEPGTLISRTCGKDGEKDDSFKVQYVNCVFVDNLINAEGDMVSTASIRMPYNGGFSLTYAGTTPGIKAATTWGPGMTAMRTHGIYCRGDSHASTPHCLVELVHLERSEVTWSEASRIDENSSLTLCMSCPEWLVGDHGDHTSEMRQTPTHLEFHATGCDVTRYPETREAPQE